MSKSVRISSLILAFAAMALGTHMAQAQPFDAKQQANQYEYNERVQFRQPDQPRYITNDLIKVLYEQSIQEVITESKQLALLHSVYQNDLAHNAQDQIALDLNRIEEQKSRLLRAQQRVHGYAIAMANHHDSKELKTN